jgi:hypothetical protein
MNDVPARRDKQQPAPPAGQSALRIPQAQAETQLNAQIARGRELLLDAMAAPPVNLASLGHAADQWRDYNQTWLDTNLGGQAAEEYRTASTHWGSALAPGNHPATRLRLLQQDIGTEISKLQSIHARLHMWAPETDTTMTSSPVSPDAPIFIVWGAPRLPDSPSIRMDVWKGEVIASTEEELLSRIPG